MITIIITSYKEPHLVGRAIEAVLNNSIQEKYELLVAAPDKATAAVIKTYARNNKHVLYFKDKGKGKANAINELFRRARGEILILTDGDVTVGNDALPALLHAFKDPKVGCVSGRPVATNDKKTMLGYFSHLLVDAGAHTIRQRLDTKGAFLECSGYLFAFRNKIKTIPTDVAEDSIIPYLLWKQGYCIRYAPGARVFVKYPDNLKDFIKQRVRTVQSHEKLTRYAPDFPRVKTFWNEALYGSFLAFRYASTFRELLWTFLLFPIRLYIWLRAFIKRKIRHRSYTDQWERIESTK